MQVQVEDACCLLEVSDGEEVPQESEAGEPTGLLERTLR